MAFNQTIVNQVKEEAAFRCCRCQSIGIEVHHIVSQKEHGPDSFDNAAPLCPNCHTWFGDNPLKRKEILQMRNWWYKRVKEIFAPQIMDFSILNEINSKVEALNANQEKTLIDLKDTLKKVALDTIEQMTAGTARITASGIANATISPSPSPSITSEEMGGDGGEIFIISNNFSGNGLISASGGEGNKGGKGGKVHIETVNNNFTGEIVAEGGKSKK